MELGFLTDLIIGHAGTKELLHALQITAAVTPDGRADAVKRMPDGQEVFALPAYQSMPFAAFLQALRTPQKDEIAYAQTQNNRRASATHAHHADAEMEHPLQLWSSDDAGERERHCTIDTTTLVSVMGICSLRELCD